MDATDRLFALVDAKYKEQKEFASEIGVSPSIVSQWRKRISKSYTKNLAKIATALNTTAEYILTGAEPPENEQAATQKGSGLADEFVRIFDQLTPENQNAIIAEMLRRQRQGQ